MLIVGKRSIKERKWIFKKQTHVSRITSDSATVTVRSRTSTVRSIHVGTNGTLEHVQGN